MGGQSSIPRMEGVAQGRTPTSILGPVEGVAQSHTSTSILGPENVETIIENDDTKRDANFYLYTRPLEATPELDDQPFCHWSVVTEFSQPKRVFTFEAGKEDKEDNKIIATRSMEYPPKSDNLKRKELGTKCVSPKELLEHAQKVSLNGKPYDPITRNCQDWCKEFCSGISKDFLKEQFWDIKMFVLVATPIVQSSLLMASELSKTVILENIKS